MVGTLEVTGDRDAARATLGDDGRLTSDAAWLGGYLNLAHDPREAWRERSPLAGDPSIAAFYEAVEALDAAVVVAPSRGDRSGTTPSTESRAIALGVGRRPRRRPAACEEVVPARGRRV